MKQLTVLETKFVNGGVAPLVAWAAKAAVAGVVVVAKSAHTSYQARKSCKDGVKSAGVVSYKCK